MPKILETVATPSVETVVINGKESKRVRKAVEKLNREPLPNGKAKAEPKAKPETAKAKETKATEPVAEATPLTPAQVAARKPFMRVMEVLHAAQGPLTRKQIAAKVTAMGIACYAGRISNEVVTYRSLKEAGFVTEKEMVMEEGATPDTVFKLTAKGTKAVEKAKETAKKEAAEAAKEAKEAAKAKK